LRPTCKYTQFNILNLKDKILKNIYLGIEQCLLSNDELVQIIDQSGSFLNLQTISDYAKENKISYNGAKKFRKTVKIFNVKFIIDNG